MGRCVVPFHRKPRQRSRATPSAEVRRLRIVHAVRDNHCTVPSTRFGQGKTYTEKPSRQWGTEGGPLSHFSQASKGRSARYRSSPALATSFVRRTNVGDKGTSSFPCGFSNAIDTTFVGPCGSAVHRSSFRCPAARARDPASSPAHASQPRQR